MAPNPRRPGSNNTSYTSVSESEPQHPNPKVIDAASKTVIRLSGNGLDFDEIMTAFRESDNAGMRHVEECGLCLIALKAELADNRSALAQATR